MVYQVHDHTPMKGVLRSESADHYLGLSRPDHGKAYDMKELQR